MKLQIFGQHIFLKKKHFLVSATTLNDTWNPTLYNMFYLTFVYPQQSIFSTCLLRLVINCKCHLFSNHQFPEKLPALPSIRLLYCKKYNRFPLHSIFCRRNFLKSGNRKTLREVTVVQKDGLISCFQHAILNYYASLTKPLCSFSYP